MIQLWMYDGTTRHVSNHPTVKAAKTHAKKVGWTAAARRTWDTDAHFVDIAVNDFEGRKVHEYDPEKGTWYAVDMWEGANPIPA